MKAIGQYSPSSSLSSVSADLAVRNLIRLQQPDQVRPGHVQEIGRLLRGQFGGVWDDLHALPSGAGKVTDHGLPDAPAAALPLCRWDGRGYDLRHTRAAEVWPAERRLAWRLVPSVGSAGDSGVTDGGNHGDRGKEPE
jgi:hypothetical protein